MGRSLNLNKKASTLLASNGDSVTTFCHLLPSGQGPDLCLSDPAEPKLGLLQAESSWEGKLLSLSRLFQRRTKPTIEVTGTAWTH